MCMFEIKICKQILPKIVLADGETEAYFSKKTKAFLAKILYMYNISRVSIRFLQANPVHVHVWN